MNEENRIVQRADEVFTKEALKANDGKTVPLRLEFGGPVIGEATLKYDEVQKALAADFQITDPAVEEFLRGPMPSIWPMPSIFSMGPGGPYVVDENKERGSKR